MKRILLPVLAISAALLLVACGGGDESDEDKIVDVIETSATSTDPADCSELLTIAFLEQVESSEGEEAIEECEETAEDASGNPDSVDVSKVVVNGSSASADTAFNGGNFDGQTINIGLVEEDGEWKLDQIEEFVVFDRTAFLSAIESSLEEADEIDAELGACMLEELDGYSDGELEEAVLEGLSEAFVEIAESCV